MRDFRVPKTEGRDPEDMRRSWYMLLDYLIEKGVDHIEYSVDSLHKIVENTTLRLYFFSQNVDIFCHYGMTEIRDGQLWCPAAGRKVRSKQNNRNRQKRFYGRNSTILNAKRMQRRTMLNKEYTELSLTVMDNQNVSERLSLTVMDSSQNISTTALATGTYGQISSKSQTEPPVINNSLYSNLCSSLNNNTINNNQDIPKDKDISKDYFKVVSKHDNILSLNINQNINKNINEVTASTKTFLDKYQEKSKKEDEERREPRAPKKKYSLHEKPYLSRFKSVSVDQWTQMDFLGYYLNQYFAIFKSEDFDLVSKTRKEHAGYSTHIAHLQDIAVFSNTEFKKYIDWFFEIKTDPSYWRNGTVYFSDVFIKTAMLKEYKSGGNKDITNRTQIEAKLGTFKDDFRSKLWHDYVIGCRATVCNMTKMQYLNSHSVKEHKLYCEIVPETVTEFNYKPYLVEFFKKVGAK